LVVLASIVDFMIKEPVQKGQKASWEAALVLNEFGLRFKTGCGIYHIRACQSFYSLGI
jgi:hypothetical protein